MMLSILSDCSNINDYSFPFYSLVFKQAVNTYVPKSVNVYGFSRSKMKILIQTIFLAITVLLNCTGKFTQYNIKISKFQLKIQNMSSNPFKLKCLDLKIFLFAFYIKFHIFSILILKLFNLLISLFQNLPFFNYEFWEI